MPEYHPTESEAERLQPIGFVTLTDGMERTLYGASEQVESEQRRASEAADPVTVPTTTSSGEGLIYEGDMPSLEELLNSHAVLYTVLEGFERDSRGATAYESRAWIFLVAVAFVWGFLTALALALPDFWLHPATAIFGCLGTLVLLITLLTHLRERGRSSW
jgi:hypothetical protein